MNDSFSLMVHGGAGTLEYIKREGYESDVLESLRSILEGGRDILSQQGTALDAVEYCATRLEDDPLFNAGRGSVLNEDGEVEMDAAIMDGRTLRAGSVAGVTSIQNPTALARLIMDKSEHVMLIGKSASKFAQLHGMPVMSPDYFVLESRVRQWQEARRRGMVILDHENAEVDMPVQDQDSEPHKLGTVGAVARDLHGNLAAATSTGGMVNKPWGRVGDSPVVGAGLFADNQTCAVSATGHGEKLQCTVLCKMISDFIYLRQMDSSAAARAGIGYLVEKVQGLGGVIVIDNQGRCAVERSTPGMIYGLIENGGESLCLLA